MSLLQLSSSRCCVSSVSSSSRTVCGIPSFSFIPIYSSRATSTRSSSLSSATATKRCINQYNNSNILQSKKKTSPLPMMIMIRTQFTNSQKRLQQAVLNSSKATYTTSSIRQQQQQQAKKQGRKRHLLLITATTTLTFFFTINAFGTYTHYHDDLFTKYYPLPFALDVGVGYSMIPTLNPHINGLYLRDTRRNIIYKKGDVVTIYNPYTKNIVTKRIVGVGGDEICLYGEFAVEFSKLKDQHQLQQKQQQQQGEYYGGGVPLDVRFDPPFCQKQHQQQQLSCENDIQYNATMKVPPNHVWVEGDNPLQSTDSRHYGPLPISALRGRIVLRLWPFNGEHDNDSSYLNDKEGRRSCSNEWFYRLSGERPNPFKEKEE